MGNRRWCVTAVVGLASVLAGGVAQAQAPRFRVKQVLDRWAPGHWSDIRGLEDSGRAVGMVGGDPSGIRQATIFSGGTSQPLMPAPGFAHSQAYAINDNGQVVGHVFNEHPTPSQAVTWDNGQLRFLPVPQGFPHSDARAININGDIIGQLSTNVNAFNEFSRGAFWHDGQVEVIGPDNTRVTGINARRQIVGCTGDDFSSKAAPFMWELGQYRPLPPVTTGATGCAYAINDAGLIVGRSAFRPVMWQAGKAVSIGPPNSQGTATHLNNRGEALGEVGGQISTRQWYRPASGGLYDLRGLIDMPAGAPVTTFGPFMAINDRGELLAQGRDAEGAQFIALLEPYTPSGPDSQAPVISLTSPTTGSYVSGLVTLQAAVSDNVGVAAVTFFAEGRRVGSLTLTAPPWQVDLDTFRFDNGPLLIWAEARDAAGNVSITNMKSIMIQNKCQSVSTGQTLHGWLGNQTGTFTVRWSSQVFSDDFMDGGFALAKGKPGYFSGTNAIVLFAPDREVKVRNGASYPPSGVRYALERHMFFRMQVDVPTNRYSVWMKMPNQPETQLAAGYAFRSPTSYLDGWMMRVDDAAGGNILKVCNVSVKAN